MRILDISKTGLEIRLARPGDDGDNYLRQLAGRTRLGFDRERFAKDEAAIRQQYEDGKMPGYNGQILQVVGLQPGTTFPAFTRSAPLPALLLLEEVRYSTLIAANKQWGEVRGDDWHQRLARSRTGVPWGFAANCALIISLVTDAGDKPMLFDHWRSGNLTNEPNCLAQAVAEGLSPVDLVGAEIDVMRAAHRGLNEEAGLEASDIDGGVHLSEIIVEGSGNISIIGTASTTRSFDDLCGALADSRRHQLKNDGMLEAGAFYSTSFGSTEEITRALIDPVPSRVIRPDESNSTLEVADFKGFPAHHHLSTRVPATIALAERRLGHEFGPTLMRALHRSIPTLDQINV